ncbi:MAG: hypothetical protein KA319_04685 [Ferruginibacter sp.]|nr:hypothetical protein [Ferruginibacter sp.]
MWRLTLLTFFVCSIFTAVAQPPKKTTPKATAVKGFKPPKLTTTLGIYKDSATIFVEEGLQLIATPLKITDDKGGKYTISSYQFLYKKIGVAEEENEDGPTGKTRPVTSISADLFKATPLTKIWVTTIQEQLKKGEEFFFFDVIVKDEQGRLMFAPTLKLKMK